MHPHQLRAPGPGPNNSNSNHYIPQPPPPNHYPTGTPNATPHMQRHPSNASMAVGSPYQHATAAAYQAQQQIARQQEQMKYNPPAAPVVFTLPENVTSQIPEETAERFLRDAQGQLLWFAVPPLDNGCGGSGDGESFGSSGSSGIGGGYGGGLRALGGSSGSGGGSGGGGEVGHSVQYLARRRELEVRRELRERARRSEMEEAKRKWEQWQEDEKREAKRVLVRALGLMAGCGSP